MDITSILFQSILASFSGGFVIFSMFSKKIEKTVEKNDYVDKLVQFIRESKRGVGIKTNKKAFNAGVNSGE